VLEICSAVAVVKLSPLAFVRLALVLAASLLLWTYSAGQLRGVHAGTSAAEENSLNDKCDQV
jgi:hypothetical protein